MSLVNRRTLEQFFEIVNNVLLEEKRSQETMEDKNHQLYPSHYSQRSLNIALEGTAEDVNRLLFGCIQRGDTSSMRQLLKSEKIDLAARSERNLSFLQEACMPNLSYPVKKNIQYYIIELLIQAGVDCRRSADQEPWMTPLLLCTSMMLRLDGDEENADSHRFWCIAEDLLNADAEIGATTRDGKNIMHLLCSARWKPTDQIYRLDYFRSDIASQSIEKGPKGLLDAQDDKGQTPLHLLCKRKVMNTVLFQFLLENNPKVTLQDKDGRTPFDYRVMHDDMCGCFRLFHSDRDEDPNAKTTIYSAAVRFNDFTTIERCLDDSDINIDKEELIGMVDHFGDSLLHNACSGNPSDAMLRLALRLMELGANVNVRNHIDQTPLHYCCKEECEAKMQVIEELVRRGADVNAIGQDGETPLYNVIQDGNMVVTRWLVEKANADVNLKNTGDRKRPPLFYAKTKSMAKLLLEIGADPKKGGPVGYTVLHDFSFPIEIKIYLLESKAIPVDIQNDHGETALFAFCQHFDETDLHDLDDIEWGLRYGEKSFPWKITGYSNYNFFSMEQAHISRTTKVLLRLWLCVHAILLASDLWETLSFISSIISDIAF